jgi:hypothetical protein
LTNHLRVTCSPFYLSFQGEGNGDKRKSVLNNGNLGDPHSMPTAGLLEAYSQSQLPSLVLLSRKFPRFGGNISGSRNMEVI